MNELHIFENAEFGQIRTLQLNNEIYFVGKDVAIALGYSETNAMTKRLDKEDFISARMEGMNMKSTLINESGLYAAILGSKLPAAKRFKHWVTSEVLPAIRKHGMYATEQTIDNILNDPDFGIKLLTQLKEERAKSQTLQKQIEADRPKTLFADAVSASKTSILIGDLAKLLKQNGYDTGQKRLFEQLRQEGYLIKSGSSKNMPTQKAMEKGLFEVKETNITNLDGSNRIIMTAKVTGVGQQYFINKFLRGISA